jgi:hypothetical protein
VIVVLLVAVFDLNSLLGGNRYPNYRPPYYGGAGSYYPGGGGGFQGSSYYPQQPGYGYGTNFIGGSGYGGQGGNAGLDSYYGYNNRDYQGGGNLGFGYYSTDQFQNRNIQPQVTPTGYRGYN